MNMGIGPLGSPSIIIKRKFRWTFEITKPQAVPPYYVKLGNRPKLDVDETEVSYLNGVTWIPGRAKWQPLTITWRDVPKAEMAGLWNWITIVYNFQQPAQLGQSEKRGWYGEGRLQLYDGCGSVLETWTLMSMWPQSIDWGDLDYASSDEVTMAVTFRFSEVNYQGSCGQPTPVGSCQGCG